MSASNDFENAILLLVFNNTDIANIGDAAGLQNSATAGSLYVALHSSDPGETGKQNTNEVSYTGYARVAVARSGVGWTVSSSTVSNAAAVTFTICSGGSATATHFSIGYESSGATNIVVSGALTSSLAISSGITPSFAIGALTASVD